MNLEERLATLGAAVPELLVPKSGTDLSKWAVIACDQFTQDSSYWARVREAAGGEPSALDCIIPEAFLGETESRAGAVHEAMNKYLAGGLFTRYRSCMYVERDTPYRAGRKGVLICVDLERYDWHPGSTPLIRPTEGTVPERLPARMELRRGAALELPHILLLIDDERNTLIPALGERARTARPVYDTPLMLDSGSVRGWLLGEAEMEILADGLEQLAVSPAAGGTETAFLYAVGDGNHSLAAAKGIWEDYKKTGGPDHPCRWALVELENIYDPALVFEPIHRFIYGARRGEMEQVLAALPGFSLKKLGGMEEYGRLLSLVKEPAGHTRFGLAIRTGFETELFLAAFDLTALALDQIQPLLDAFTTDRPELSLDYIHGEDELFRLASRSGGAAVLLPPFNKQSLFRAVASRGILPRKSFSMGEAVEKRFYLECRKLFA
jgi:hypothetical protein